MAYKFTYVTVQHSGTRFLERYFLHLGFSPLRYTHKCRICGRLHGYEEHTDEHNSSGRIEYNWRHYLTRPRLNVHTPLDMHPIISTLRHPYKTAISFLSRGSDLRMCVDMWDNFIKLSAVRPLIYYNIDCKEENRKAQLLDMIKRVDCYEDNTEILTNKFVLDWKPIGVYDSDIKNEYARTGNLPDVFSWDRFDRAVNWYEKKIEECKY